MDSLVFPQPAPKPLILPRRLSLHGSPRGQRHWFPGSGNGGGLSPSSPDKDDSTHYHYFSTAPLSQYHYCPDQQQQQIQAQVQAYDQVVSQGTRLSGSPKLSPVLFSFGGDHQQSSSQNQNATATASSCKATAAAHDSGLTGVSYRSKPSRRHSVSNGSPWTSIPPRHALHMPVMKIDPSVWRSEQHQREIYRLMHEGRDEEVMRRRGIRSVMDTMTEEDEDDRSGNMSGVVQTPDLGGFKAAEEREKELVRQQVRQEWAKLVEEQTKEYEQLLQQAATSAATEDSRRRNSWPVQLSQQQFQFKMPNQVLHPILTGVTAAAPSHSPLPPPPPPPPCLSQQPQVPCQLPPPGVQQSMGQQGPMGLMTAGPLLNPAAWSAAPTFPNIDTHRPSFAVYRG